MWFFEWECCDDSEGMKKPTDDDYLKFYEYKSTIVIIVKNTLKKDSVTAKYIDVMYEFEISKKPVELFVPNV